MFGTTCRVTKRLTAGERRAVRALLEASGLLFEGEPEYTALVEDCDERLAATASLEGRVIKMVAADPQWQEAGLSGTVVSALIRAAREEGRFHLFIYTKPDMASRFAGLGFTELAASQKAVLMECGTPNAAEFRAGLEALRGTEEAGAIVMNCNPFTKGHRYLIEKAASESRRLFVIVVEEDASVFPFADRIELVRRGTADLTNVRVIPSGSYAVSSATFPTYFLKDRADMIVAAVQAELDAALFGRLYVPALGITRRFVGTEPLCPVTAIYNERLKAALPKYGCEVTEIERLAADGAPVSASRVRSIIAEGGAGLEGLLPPVTLEYLASEGGRAAAKRLRSAK